MPRTSERGQDEPKVKEHGAPSRSPILADPHESWSPMRFCPPTALCNCLTASNVSRAPMILSCPFVRTGSPVPPRPMVGLGSRGRIARSALLKNSRGPPRDRQKPPHFAPASRSALVVHHVNLGLRRLPRARCVLSGRQPSGEPQNWYHDLNQARHRRPIVCKIQITTDPDLDQLLWSRLGTAVLAFVEELTRRFIDIGSDLGWQEDLSWSVESGTTIWCGPDARPTLWLPPRYRHGETIRSVDRAAPVAEANATWSEALIRARPARRIWYSRNALQ